MKPIDMIGLVTTSSPEFAKTWADACRQGQVEQDNWIAALRAEGVKAAHPDDGWVDRERNEVRPSYPQFNDGVAVGDVIALGWPSRHRLVRVTSVGTYGVIGTWPAWGFEKIEDPVFPVQSSVVPGWIRKLVGRRS